MSKTHTTVPSSVYSVITCGMNYGKKCLFSTHVQLEIPYFMLCVASQINHSKSLSLKKTISEHFQFHNPCQTNTES